MNLCVACGDSNPEHLDHHHLVPRSRGGGNDETNLITLCRECHGKLHGIEWRNNHRDLTREGQARSRALGIKHGKPGKLTRQQRDEVVRRLLEGESARAISRSLNVSNHVIGRCAKMAGLTTGQGARKPGSWKRTREPTPIQGRTRQEIAEEMERFRDFWQ
jgi:hypothetical protein